MSASAPILASLSLLYRTGLAARDLYRLARPLTPIHLGVPTIGVGNLSMGGTGKTSMVSWLAERLDRAGIGVGILSRGYRRPDASRSPQIVSRGDGRRVAWELAGDEPYLLARRHPRAVVVVGADRVAAGRIAVTELGAEVLVLDDAHQHRRVAQDLAILMVDARRVPWEDHLIPWGRLREPPSAARRAQVSVLLVAEGAATANPADYDRLAALGPAVFTARRRVRAVVAEPSGARYHGDGLPARRVHLFSGIGDPRGFEATVKQLGGEVTGHHIFRDHHRLGRNDLVDLEAQARRAGAELLLTTEKDAVRMEGIASPGGIPVAYLEMELELNAELRVSGAAGHGVRLARAGEAAR